MKLNKILINKQRKISVVMPVFNRAEFLPDSINSILNQTYQDFELIIVDDGSSQSTKEVLNQFAHEDERIKVFCNQTNQGIAASRNLGNSFATGEYIAVMDSDDICALDRFEKQVYFLDRNPDIDLVGSQVMFIDAFGKFQREFHYPLTPGLIKWNLLFNCPLCHPSVMMRRKLFSDEGYQYIPVPPIEDYDLFVRLSDRHKFANLNESLLYYRRHENNFTKLKQKENHQQVIITIQSQVKNLVDLEMSHALVSGLIDSTNLSNVRDAIELGRIIVSLLSKVKFWDFSNEEKMNVRRAGAFKLRSIWHAQNHDIRLYPYILYSIFLDYTVITRKLTSLFQ